MNSLVERITELVIKHLNGELNEAERTELQNWVDQSEENRSAIEDFLDEKKLQAGVSQLYQSRERIWLRLNTAIPDKKNTPVRRLFLRYSAAAAILAMVFFISYYFISNRTLDSTAGLTKDTVQHKIINDVSPGGDRAVLQLADGSSIVLDSAADGMLTQQGNAFVIKSDHGQLAYQPADNSAASPGTPIYNTLTTPPGGQYRLLLPDGSKVWLNATSSLRFPTAFAGNERSVTLTGEAYFEIAKNAAKPFKVNIGSTSSSDGLGQVEVLGTHFNVNAYNDEPVIKTTLLEGSVKVSAFRMQTNGRGSKTIIPGQQAVFSSSGTGIINVIDNADLDEAVAWKNGLLQMTSADIKNIMRQIARWYNVEVAYESAVPSGHITGKVSRNMQLSKVLEVLELSGIRCRMEGRKLIVLP